MKKCIFYLPYQLDEKGAGARMLRPRKMIQAFCDIGYEVTVIDGFSKERRKKIAEVKKAITVGEKFDFMYTESHTEPTLLTDPGHLPTHPLLDFSFFRFIKSHNIPIGLFYCDIYWKFESYGLNLPKWKRWGALLCYRYDIVQYKKYLSRFYIPDLKMCNYLNEKKLTEIAEELPPGADDFSVCLQDRRDFTDKPITIFYVGGLGGHYQIIELVKAVNQVKDCRLILCCREGEWQKEKSVFEPYLNDRIIIIHKNSSELEPYYEEADIGSLLFRGGQYMEMAKPFKAYEYLAHEMPVLSTKGTAIGRFVEENDIGWNIDFEATTIATTIEQIIDCPKILEEKRENCKKAKMENLWITRAKQVEKDLISC